MDEERYFDDWAPNLRGLESKRDEVEVSIIGWKKNYHNDAEQPSYRIAVWGGNDLGYEKDYYFKEVTPEKLLHFVLSFPEPLTKEYLKLLGFYPS